MLPCSKDSNKSRDTSKSSKDRISHSLLFAISPRDGIKTLGTKDQQKVNGYVKHASALTTAADIQPIEFRNQ